MIITKIDFIKMANRDLNIVDYSASDIFHTKLSPEETGAGFDSAYSKPRTLKFTLNKENDFFVAFRRPQNMIGEFSSYFIRVYDIYDNRVFSGIIKRSDYDVNEEENEITILAKDFSVLLSAVKDVAVNYSDVLSSSLKDIANAYDYYIKQASIVYFDSEFSLELDTTDLTSDVIELDYQEKSIKLIDIINMFSVFNNHIFSCEGETIKISNTRFYRYDYNVETILVSDTTDWKESNAVISKINSNVIPSNLNTNFAYQFQMIELFNSAYNDFVDSVSIKVTCKIRTTLNDYNLKLNQVIKRGSERYVIKSIDDSIQGIYDVILWNNAGLKTVNRMWIGTNEKITATNPTTNRLWIGTNRGALSTINRLWIGTNVGNGVTKNRLWIGTNEY